MFYFHGIVQLCRPLTYVVLLTELLGERGRHDVAADRRGSTEVSLSRLASGAGDTGCSVLRHFCCGLVESGVVLTGTEVEEIGRARRSRRGREGLSEKTSLARKFGSRRKIKISGGRLWVAN